MGVLERELLDTGKQDPVELILPVTRWLFEYSQENFRRQDQLNRVLFSCIEELALDNARLRRDLQQR